ncbi:hypothetical protein CH263_08370 [Rhodococcus sp. 06-1059B-a]|nr:thermonuclease family protein [Rhodococcus sp. 06-1059B-a]OZD68904.1 hypothetical protein CH263_08370 [Rhodococcus sp. 06-1059B-a]
MSAPSRFSAQSPRLSRTGTRVFTVCVAAPTVAAILTGCDPLTAPPNPARAADAVSATSGVVDRVIDGDTVDVRLSTGGDPVRVRILGIDTPETVDPDAPVQCWGPEASAWAHQQLDDTTITLTADPVADDTDHYGRHLRYVQLPDGSNYSVRAAETGMARAYIYRGQHLTEAANVTAAQATAQSNGAGLWGAPCFGDTARR